MGIPKFETGPQKSTHGIKSAAHSHFLTIAPWDAFPFPPGGRLQKGDKKLPEQLRGLREKGQRTRGADIAQHGIRPDLRIDGFDEGCHGG